jgi:hypothetical protein
MAVMKKKPKKQTAKEKWQTKKKTSDKDFHKKMEQKELKKWFDSDKPTKKPAPARHIKTTVGGKVVKLRGKEVKQKT